MSWLGHTRSLVSKRHPAHASGVFRVSVFVLFLLVGSLLLAPQLCSASEGKLREILFLIDVSGSMIGLPAGSGNRDIFPEILRPIVNHVRSDARVGDTLHILTFAHGIHAVSQAGGYPGTWTRRIAFEQDKVDVVRYVEGLNLALRERGGAGSRTAIRDSVAIALARLQEFQERYPGGRRAYRDRYDQLLVLFTDGRDNVSRVTPEEIARRFDLLRSEEYMGNNILWAYYALANAPIPADLPAGVVTASRIPERFVYLTVEPGTLSFGRMTPSGEGTSASLALHAQGEFNASAVTFTTTGLQLPGGAAAAVVSERQAIASQDREMKLTLKVSNPAALLAEAERRQHDQAYTGQIGLSVADPLVRLSRDRVSFSFTVPVPKWVKVTVSGAESLPIVLGSLQEKIGAEIPLALEFSPGAGEASLGLKLVPGSDNPTPLSIPDHVALETGGHRSKDLAVRREGGPVRLLVGASEAVRQAGLKAGQYGFDVEFQTSPADLEVRVIGRDGKPLPLTGKRIVFRFSVPKAPWGPLAWGVAIGIPLLLAAAVALAFAKVREDRKLLRGKVIHLRPDETVQKEIDFDPPSPRARICRFGAVSGAHFPLTGAENIEAKLCVELVGGRPTYVLECNGPHIQLAGSTDRVSRTELFNRDAFTIGTDRFEYRNAAALRRGGR